MWKNKYSPMSTNNFRLSVASAYSGLYNGEEPPYTTWKIRQDAEYCETIDYVFHR